MSTNSVTGSPKKTRRAVSMPGTPQGVQQSDKDRERDRDKDKEKGVDFEGDAVMVSARSQSDRRAHSANQNQRKSGMLEIFMKKKHQLFQSSQAFYKLLISI